MTDMLQDELSWSDLALCNDSNSMLTLDESMKKTNLFFDNYESSVSIALNIDKLCMSCPVVRECLSAGMSGGSWGVWGGVYLIYGKPDRNKNSHKNEDTWEELEELHGFDPREYQQDS